MTISIVADQGTHLLIADGKRYAVVERRNDRFYNCHGDKRSDAAVDDVATIGQILDESDWTEKAAAKQTFDQIIERGNQLAQKL